MKWILKAIGILISVTIITFLLMHVSTIDPAEAYARRNFTNPTEKQITEITHRLGYDEPLVKQYCKYMKGILKGDLGISLVTNNPVLEDIVTKLKPTLSLVVITSIWIILLTLVFGIISAIYYNSVLDHIIRVITIIGISMPSFWLGYLLLLLLAVKIPMFKVVDYGGIKSYILPSFAFALPVASSLIRILRSNILSEFSKDYYLYARARGLKGGRLMTHVIRNAIPPVIIMFFQNVGFLIGGSAIIESVFSWPGFGEYFVQAILERDLPSISGNVLMIAIIFLLCNWIGDRISIRLNPIIGSRE